MAGRLAEADPSLSILVVEGGPDNRGVQNIEHPVFFLDHLLPTSKTTIFYKGNKAEQLNGREPVIACGGTLGGGSSINFSMYTRAQRSDLDSWNTPGWSANDLVPFLQKVRCSIVMPRRISTDRPQRSRHSMAKRSTSLMAPVDLFKSAAAHSAPRTRKATLSRLQPRLAGRSMMTSRCWMPTTASSAGTAMFRRRVDGKIPPRHTFTRR